MTTLKINIPQGYEIDVFNKETGEVSFKKIELKYPQSIFEVKDRSWFIHSNSGIEKDNTANDSTVDRNNVSTKQRAEALLALSQLVELRDAWNKIDGFVVDWTANDVKYVIKGCSGKLQKDYYYNNHYILYFGSEQTRDLFFETFSKLIETAKEFL